MALEITSTNAITAEQAVKMVVYGRSGTGKTSLLATAPKPIILSGERGLLSLSPANQRRMFGKVVDIDVLQIDTEEDLLEAYEGLTSYPNPYQTIALDSATEIAELILHSAKKQVKDPRQAYGELLERMMVVFRAFRDIPDKHVVFIAQEEARGQNDTTMFGPALPGSKLGNKMPYIFDEVFHLAIGKTPEGQEYRYLQTKVDLQFDAKDRSGALDAIEEPNLTNIINKIRHG